jgi:DNA-binding transcriptional ArsR family regulator
MEDIRSVLSQFHTKKKKTDIQKSGDGPQAEPSTSAIPDLFFDEVILKFKISRQEIAILMCLYRQIWSKPNLYRSHGIGPLNSYQQLATALHLSIDELTHGLRSLENLGLIETVRSGQYFIRKYFTEEFDNKFGQDYDQFL